jgi:large subunit ribosomal protein L18
MPKTFDRSKMRILRHVRLRKRISGGPDRPRLSVFHSNRHFYVQLIDDESGKTLLALSTKSPDLQPKLTGKPVERATLLGTELGQRAAGAGIKHVVFDRGGHAFHGQVKAMAEAARAAGLEF